MTQNVLVGYEADFYYSSQSGLLVIPEELHKAALGHEMYLGEAAGKHSEVYLTLDDRNFMVISRDQDLIARLNDVMPADPWGTLHGCNPLDTLYDTLFDDAPDSIGDDKFQELSDRPDRLGALQQLLDWSAE